MRRFLLISSFLSSLLLISCSPAAGLRLRQSKQITAGDIAPLIDPAKSLLFKTKIDLYNRHFSGLMLFKQTDANTSHITFVTEIGMKMFDFEVRDSSFKPVYLFEPLNKPELINLLKSDLELIVLHHLEKKQAEIYEGKTRRVIKVSDNYRYYYEVEPNRKLVEKVIKKGKLFTKVKTSYSWNREKAEPETIYLKHKGFVRLRIRMSKLEKS